MLLAKVIQLFHMTKKNPYIQDHPPPVFIREKIQDAILNYNTDIRMQCEAGQISAQQLQAQMFPLNADTVISKAVTLACDIYTEQHNLRGDNAKD